MRLALIGLITVVIAGPGMAASTSVQDLQYTLNYGPQVQVPIQLAAKTETKIINTKSKTEEDKARAEKKRKLEAEKKRKAEAEKKRKLEAEKKRKLEAEKKRKAEEEEKKKAEEAKRKLEEEKKRKAEEAAAQGAASSGPTEDSTEQDAAPATTGGISGLANVDLQNVKARLQQVTEDVSRSFLTFPPDKQRRVLQETQLEQGRCEGGRCLAPYNFFQQQGIEIDLEKVGELLSVLKELQKAGFTDAQISSELTGLNPSNLSAYALRLDVEDPNNSVETHNALSEAHSNLREAEIAKAREENERACSKMCEAEHLATVMEASTPYVAALVACAAKVIGGSVCVVAATVVYLKALKRAATEKEKCLEECE